MKEAFGDDVDVAGSMGLIGDPGVISLKKQQFLVLVEHEVRTAEWFPMEELLGGSKTSWSRRSCVGRGQSACGMVLILSHLRYHFRTRDGMDLTDFDEHMRSSLPMSWTQQPAHPRQRSRACQPAHSETDLRCLGTGHAATTGDLHPQQHRRDSEQPAQQRYGTWLRESGGPPPEEAPDRVTRPSRP